MFASLSLSTISVAQFRYALAPLWLRLQVQLAVKLTLISHVFTSHHYREKRLKIPLTFSV